MAVKSASYACTCDPIVKPRFALAVAATAVNSDKAFDMAKYNDITILCS